MNAEEIRVKSTIRWLRQVRKLDELINAKIAERDQLFAMATNITPNMDGMPHGSEVSDKVGNAAVRLADMAEEIDAQVDEFIAKRAEVIKAIEKLPPNQYGALHRYYIQYMSWEEVAEDMGKSFAQVMRYRRKGVKNLSK